MRRPAFFSIGVTIGVLLASLMGCGGRDSEEICEDAGGEYGDITERIDESREITYVGCSVEVP